MRVNDLVFAFPALLLAIMITALLGPGAVNAILAIGIFNVPVFARLTRGAALSLWTRDYVLAARVAGKGPWLISIEHILPNLAQHAGGAGDHPVLARHPGRGGALLCRPRHAAAGDELGPDARRRADHDRAGAAAGDPAGPGHRRSRCSASTSSATACATCSTRRWRRAADEPALPSTTSTVSIGSHADPQGRVACRRARRGAGPRRRIGLGQVDDGARRHAPAAAPGGRRRARSRSTAPTSWRSTSAAMCGHRGRTLGMVFQEPMSALNPVKTIGAQVAETVRVHRAVRRRRRPPTWRARRSTASACRRRAFRSTPIRTSFPAASASAW